MSSLCLAAGLSNSPALAADPVLVNGFSSDQRVRKQCLAVARILSIAMMRIPAIQWGICTGGILSAMRDAQSTIFRFGQSQSTLATVVLCIHRWITRGCQAVQHLTWQQRLTAMELSEVQEAVQTQLRYVYLTSSTGITHLTDLDTRSRVLTLRFPHSGNPSGLEEHLADDTIDTECATFLDSRTRCIGRNVHSNMVLLHCIQFRLSFCRRCICETTQAYAWNIFRKPSACDSSQCRLLEAPQICLQMAK